MDKLQKTIFLASDHAGFQLKETIKAYLKSKNIKLEDLGPESPDRCDYPDYAGKLCTQVQSSGNFGILVCGTGTGISIAANKYKGIRCAICNSLYVAQNSIEKDNPNVIAMGERVIGPDVAKSIVDIFLKYLSTEPQIVKEDLEDLKKIENQNLIN